ERHGSVSPLPCHLYTESDPVRLPRPSRPFPQGLKALGSQRMPVRVALACSHDPPAASIRTERRESMQAKLIDTPASTLRSLAPLCVDLDGTLVKSDTLLDSLLVLLRTRPLKALALPAKVF